MASPFRYFRKHTKAFMAVAAVMCMFLFVFASGTGGSRNRNGYQDAAMTVATWNGGSLNQRELASLVRQRVIVDEFLKRLFTQGGGRTGYDLPASVPQLLLGSQRGDQVENDVIATEVMADLARQAGISVSDDMINHYVEEFGLKNVSRDEILGILGSVGQNDVRENESIVFSMLRKMLAAYFYRSTFEDASSIVMPEERWDDWRRVNERISLEAAELPVESFEKDVPAPTDAQLQALYNEFKDADPDQLLSVAGTSLPSPSPGFAEPRRVKLAFLLGSVGERTEKQLDKVTEEEIADYYERNKRRDFVKTDFGQDETDEEKPDEDKPAEGAEGAAPAEGATPAEGASENAEEEQPAAAAPAEGAAEPASPAAQDASSPGATEQPAPAAGEQPAPAADEQAPAAEQPAEAPDNASSEATRKSPFRLAALQQPAGDDEAAPAEPAADTPADPAAAQSAPADAAAESQPADAAATDEAAPDPKDDDKILDEVLEFEPLDKVRDEIRRTLARDKAVQELEQVMSEAAAELETEYNRYGLDVAMAIEEKREPPKAPERLADLKWLADKYGVTYEKTAALTSRELFETAVGKAADVQSSTASVTQAAFTSLKPYEPFLARELEGDWYLVLKTDDEPRRVPEFNEIRDRVAAAWKRREAAKLAETKAKELAEELGKSSEAFDAFFKGKGYKVIDQTDLFSWLSYPTGPGQGQPPSMSEAPPLKNVGPDFLDAAFALKDDEAKGLMNFDRSTAYVVRLNSRQYSETELKKLFLEDDSSFWPGRNELRYQRYYNAKGVVDRKILEDRAKFKFSDEWIKLKVERERGDG